ncbi:hypothetical protein [Aliikangiella sp. IMCC44359]|uniref:hypothetical protein n=1 Tax=Aliikangiella sp. IMCC44359 TaxID=3459125 RepID=UPI00403B34DE
MSEDKFSLIHVGPNGTFSPSGKYSTSKQDLEDIIKNISKQNKKRLVCYFHGGLVSEKSGVESAIKVNKEIKHNDHYVVSFIWETGLIETLTDNLDDIFSSKQGKRLLKWVIRAVTKKLAFGTLKGASGSGVSIEDIEKEMNNAKPFDEFDQKSQVGTRSAALNLDSEADKEDLEQEMREEIEDYYFRKNDDELSWFSEKPSKVNSGLTKEYSDTQSRGVGFLGIAKAVVKIAWKVLKRYRKKSEHGLHATVIEEICRAYYISETGQWVWGQMKEKAEQMWQDGKVGAEFLRLLAEHAPNQTVDLIGHSAGSICISHLLNKNQQIPTPINIDHLFLLAPAARNDLFHQQIISPELAGEKRFNQFRMFTMKDSFERDDNLVKLIPGLYPSSLLYFISGVLETKADSPICGMTRHQKQTSVYSEPMFKDIENFLSSAGRLVTSKSPDNALSGFQTQAISHGAFDDDDPTLHSIRHCLTEGGL